MNSVILRGRLTRDPELRETNGGTNVCSFSLAVDRRRTGEEKETDFFECVAWKQSAEFLSKYGSKGRSILVEGRLQTRSYQDKEGNSRKVTEVVVNHLEFCDSRGATAEEAIAAASDKTPYVHSGGYEPAPAADSAEEDNDLPF